MDWNHTLALATLIIAICSLLDWLVSRPEETRIRTRLTEWFVKLDEYNFRSAIEGFHELFNTLMISVYGMRIRSWRFLIASAIASYGAIAFVAIVFLALGRFGTRGIESDVFQAMIGISLFVNVWIDIVSLMETRWMLQKAQGKSMVVLLCLLCLDLMFSASIFLIPFYVLLSIGEGSMVPLREVVRDVFSWSETTEPHIQVMFISTFFTSVMFYAFMILALLSWMLGLGRSRLLILIEKLESSSNLFKTVGGMLTAILGVIKGIHEIL